LDERPRSPNPSRRGHRAGDKASEETAPNRTVVALRYEPTDAQTAPKVVASGRGWVAERILELAFEHGVKVREDADLAEVLAAIDIDSEIPVEAFVAVAEILRYVYAANGTKPPRIPSR
jgi:flagellar biosynthesis protein